MWTKMNLSPCSDLARRSGALVVSGSRMSNRAIKAMRRMRVIIVASYIKFPLYRKPSRPVSKGGRLTARRW
jgi:hypothetical protein